MLLLAAGAAALPFAPARAATGGVAIVDWALLETALALDVKPIAAVELVLFREIAVEPPVPASVVDLGLRGSINFELLASLRPAVIYGSNYSAWANDTLTRIAPVREWSIYERGEAPFAKAEAAMHAIAAEHGREEAADDYIAGTQVLLKQAAERLARHAARPLLIVNFGDARHFRAFGTDSMFGDVAARLGFRNSWESGTAYSATAPVGLEALVRHPDATIAVIGPVPPEAERVLPQSALWQAMPAVRDGRVLWLPPLNPFGGLPAARRFARLLQDALEAAA